MEELIKLKAEAYDITLEIEVVLSKIKELEKKKEEINKRILAFKQGSSTVIKNEMTDELRMKEQRIIEQRLKKITPTGVQ